MCTRHITVLCQKIKYLKSMYAAVEHGPVLCSDSNILCLSWKGRVPKSEKEKPVCRRRYYEEGWLATGNGRGVVGVTFTSSHCRRDRNTPQRINFNLRGHNSEVSKTCVTLSRNWWGFLKILFYFLNSISAWNLSEWYNGGSRLTQMWFGLIGIFLLNSSV